MKERIFKIRKFIVDHAPTKRRLIQVYSALLFNSYLKGYITGDIFKGVTKNVCTPGLNCYSCPGAVTACPLGALQNAFAASGKTAPYYMLGILLLYCITFGRWICGWLCPFGFVQDLLHKIKTPKMKKGRVTKILSYFKYLLLVLFVVVFPLIYAIKDLPLPAFCKYICPAGTFGGAIGLLINPANEGSFGMLGPLFTWKFILMVSFLVSAVFIYRVFCRFFCPLGALYGIFNKIAIFGIKLDKKSCIDCGRCIATCKMDITTVGDRECINCGDCVSVCPTEAISWRGSKILLPKNEVGEKSSDSDGGNDTAYLTKRNQKKRFITGAVSTLLILSLTGSLLFFNFFHDKEVEKPILDAGDDGDEDDLDIPYGYKVGNKCPTFSLERVDGNGNINIKDLRGKVVVINFWGTWCTPCVAELPEFDHIATEYKDDIVIIPIHSVLGNSEAEKYVNTNYPNTDMIFAYDVPLDDYIDLYFEALGGGSQYPRTLVVDARGVITFAVDGGVTYDQLKAEVDKALGK